ncbi:MAG: hypothetical protein AABY22_25520, partial [Nanoarchaeota archaeon]
KKRETERKTVEEKNLIVNIKSILLEVVNAGENNVKDGGRKVVQLYKTIDFWKKEYPKSEYIYKENLIKANQYVYFLLLSFSISENEIKDEKIIRQLVSEWAILWQTLYKEVDVQNYIKDQSKLRELIFEDLYKIYLTINY